MLCLSLRVQYNALFITYPDWGFFKAMNCSATSTATLVCASSVLAPRWGVTTTFGCAMRFKVVGFFGGSSGNTSNPAPPHWPLC